MVLVPLGYWVEPFVEYGIHQKSVDVHAENQNAALVYSKGPLLKGLVRRQSSKRFA